MRSRSRRQQEEYGREQKKIGYGIKINKYIYTYIAIFPSTVSSGNCHTTELTFVRQIQAVNTKHLLGRPVIMFVMVSSGFVK